MRRRSNATSGPIYRKHIRRSELLLSSFLFVSLVLYYTMHSRLKRLKALGRKETWALKPEPSTFAPTSSFSNKDMDPVPEHLQTWTTMNYVFYWISDATNVAVWELASSMIAIGLSWSVVIHLFSVNSADAMAGDRPSLLSR